MNDIKHTDIAELLGAYALDAVDDRERALVEAHLDECDECRWEVDEHLGVAAMLGDTGSAPPIALWNRIEAGIATAESEGGRVVPLAPRRSRMVPLAAAAAAAVLVGLVGVQTARLGSTQAELAASEGRVQQLELALASGSLDAIAEQLAGDPGVTTVALGADDGSASGTVLLLPDGTGLLADHDLAPLPADRTYQLWAIQDGRVISAGLLGSDPGVVAFHIDPALLEGLVITEEVAGGVAVSEQPPLAAWLPGT